MPHEVQIARVVVEPEVHIWPGQTQTLRALRAVDAEPPLTGITPQQAQAEITEIQHGKAYTDPFHPEHAQAMARMTQLYEAKGADDDKPAAEPTAEKQLATLSDADTDNIARAALALGGEESAANIEAIAAKNFEMSQELSVLGMYERDQPGTADAIRENAHLSTAEATRAITERMMDEKFQKPYLDSGHPGHDRAVGEIVALRFISTGGLEKWKQALAQSQPQ